MKLFELFALPGHWRGDLSSINFESCAVVYKSANAIAIARQRCCPSSKDCARSSTEGSKHRNGTAWNANEQCIEGFQGVMCGECAANYARLGNSCIACPGGWQLGGVIGSMLGSCLVICGVSFAILFFTTKLDKRSKSKVTHEEISAQLKILMSWLQILSVLTVTFDGIPWVRNRNFCCCACVHAHYCGLTVVSLFSVCRREHRLHRTRKAVARL